MKNGGDEFETKHRTKSGEIRDVLVNARVVELAGKPFLYCVFHDITEIRRVQEALMKSETQYRQLVNVAQEGIWVLDRYDRTVFVNPRMANMLGYAESEMVGKNLFDFVSKAEVEQAIQYLAQFKTGAEGTFEYEFPRKDGSKVCTNIAASQIKDDEGNRIGTLALVSNITLRKKTENELKQERNNLETITESIGVGLTIISKDYHILWTNKVMKQVRGITDLEGRTCYATYNYLDTVCPDCGVKKIFEGKEFDSREYTVFDKERGSTVWMQLIATPIKDKDGNVTAAIELVLPITERKKAEEALLESQQKFSALFAANPEAAAFLDLNFRVIEANARFSMLFGYSFDEIKGKVITDVIVPEEAKEESKTIRQKLLLGPVEIIAARKRKDGSLVTLLMSGGPILSGKKVIGAVMLYKDISEIITVQEELSKALAKAELLNEKLNVVGGFTRHDVRNKLSTIIGYSYILKKKYADKPDIINGLCNMERSVKESMKIFDFARAYEQLGAEELVEVNVEKTVEEAAGMFSGLPFKVVNDCAGLTVRADSLLRQLIYNLFDNTRKYGKKTTKVRVYYKKTVSKQDRANL